MRLILIGCFGFAGTIARYGLQGAVQRLSGSTFPYGTLAVNVIGSFVVGFVAALTLERVMIS
ncbi:MAG TPA: CrcB family protein, partial [Candidatus Eisenbacteria bacterium]|nr:CrcB family protein [Candidatus Eisenbacteria bacterium]